MNLRLRWWIAGLGAAAVTLAVGAGVVMAQTPSGSSTPAADSTQSAIATPEQSETPQSETGPNDSPPAPPAEGMSGRCGLKGASLTDLATFLGTDEATLRTELQADGATLASVAHAHGQSREALIAFLTEQFEANLDKKVAAGDLMQEKADARMARFTENVDEMIDSTGGPRFGGRHGGVMRGTDASPDSDTTPSSESSF